MKKTVILANGAFPKKGSIPWMLLESAKRVVACDGAATAFARHFRRAPAFVVGDLDSLAYHREPSVPARPTPPLPTIIHIAEQDDNDLAKAIRFCRSRGWRDLVIVGATGKREDHALGNIFRAMEAGIEVVTECGRFLPAAERLRLSMTKGNPISIFATDPKTRMVSRGLEWPLDGVKFENLYCATLNRAAAKTVEISSTRPFFAYIADL